MTVWLQSSVVHSHNVLQRNRSRNSPHFLWKTKIKLGHNQDKGLVYEGSSNKPNIDLGIVGLWLLSYCPIIKTQGGSTKYWVYRNEHTFQKPDVSV